MLFHEQKHRYERRDGNSEFVSNTIRMLSSITAYNKDLITSIVVKNETIGSEKQRMACKAQHAVNIF
jgi:hypothetical protein